MNIGIDKGFCIRVMEAAELDIMRNIMYALIKLGKLCVIEFGKRLLMQVAGLDKMIRRMRDTTQRMKRSEQWVPG